MKLFWSSRSPYVRIVMIAVHELGLSDKIETIETLVTGLSPAPELEPYNPLARIPTLVLPDATAVIESGAIVDYLDVHFGARRLLPETYPKRGDTLRRAALAQGICDRAMLLIRERFRPQGQDWPAVVEGHERLINGTLDALDAEAAYWAEQDVDLGHIVAAAALGYLDFRFDNLNWRSNRPKLAAWHTGFAQRSAYRNTEYHDGLQGGSPLSKGEQNSN